MNWFLSALVGAATGVLSGFGVGGGTLLLLWLTLVQGMDQFQAGGINLVYFAACALPALWGHLRQGLVDRPTARWSILTGVPDCVAAAFFAASLDVTLLRRIFGIFLLVVGFRELFSKPEKSSHSPRKGAHNSRNPAQTNHRTQPGQSAEKSTEKG